MPKKLPRERSRSFRLLLLRGHLARVEPRGHRGLRATVARLPQVTLTLTLVAVTVGRDVTLTQDRSAPNGTVLETRIVNESLEPTWLLEARVAREGELLEEVFDREAGEVDLELVVDLEREEKIVLKQIYSSCQIRYSLSLVVSLLTVDQM